MTFTVVIPARYHSTRLPGKPLLDINGKPLIQHVYERAIESNADKVIIATDDKRIEIAALKFGATVCMTADTHRSGTDRIKEVIDKCEIAANEIVVNVQGDEPMLPAKNINQVANLLLGNTTCSVATLYSLIKNSVDLFNPNIVKLVKSKHDTAMYFSRAPIPWDRNNFDTTTSADSVKLTIKSHYHHVGIYAYRSAFVTKYVSWEATMLEELESLEQLRILENGESITVALAQETPGIGVDTQADLVLVRELISKKIN